MGVKKRLILDKASAVSSQLELFGPWDFDPMPEVQEQQFQQILNDMKQRRRRSGKQIIKVKLGGSRL